MPSTRTQKYLTDESDARWTPAAVAPERPWHAQIREAAATATEHRLTLATRNARDFEGSGGRKVRQPA